jgi:restriction endonuclease Mrr
MGWLGKIAGDIAGDMFKHAVRGLGQSASGGTAAAVAGAVDQSGMLDHGAADVHRLTHAAEALANAKSGAGQAAAAGRLVRAAQIGWHDVRRAADAVQDRPGLERTLLPGAERMQDAALDVESARRLSYTGFELRVANALYDRGLTDVTRVGGSGDFGIDVRASLNGHPLVVQCKNYDMKKAIPPETVESFAGAMAYEASTRHEQVPYGIFVTTSRFTKAAREVGDRLGIALVDGNDLGKLFDPQRGGELEIPQPVFDLGAHAAGPLPRPPSTVLPGLQEQRQAVLTVESARRLTGTQFEFSTRNALVDRHIEDAAQVGGAGDFGVDVRGTLPTGRPLVVQCKNYVDTSAIDPETMNAFVGAMLFDAMRPGHTMPRGLFVTTSKFSDHAQMIANELGISTIDKNSFRQLFDPRCAGELVIPVPKVGITETQPMAG